MAENIRENLQRGKNRVAWPISRQPPGADRRARCKEMAVINA